MTVDGKFIYGVGDHLSDVGNGLVAPRLIEFLAAHP
jgi:hypothetical protein